MKLIAHIHPVPWLRIRGVIRPLPQSFRGMLLNEVLELIIIIIIIIITKLSVTLLWVLLVSVYPLGKLETFPPLAPVMPHDLAFQQGASRLQTTFANLWTFPINITSLLRIHFPLLNPTELRHYHVTCIILFPRIKF
jgi:hypothetical protein